MRYRALGALLAVALIHHPLPAQAILSGLAEGLKAAGQSAQHMEEVNAAYRAQMAPLIAAMRARWAPLGAPVQGDAYLVDYIHAERKGNLYVLWFGVGYGGTRTLTSGDASQVGAQRVLVHAGIRCKTNPTLIGDVEAAYSATGESVLAVRLPKEALAADEPIPGTWEDLITRTVCTREAAQRRMADSLHRSVTAADFDAAHPDPHSFHEVAQQASPAPAQPSSTPAAAPTQEPSGSGDWLTVSDGTADRQLEIARNTISDATGLDPSVGAGRSAVVRLTAPSGTLVTRIVVRCDAGDVYTPDTAATSPVVFTHPPLNSWQAATFRALCSAGAR